MKFFCNGCDLMKPQISLSACVADGKELLRFCRDCRRPKAAVPDVFWDGKPEINLADNPLTGKPITFSGKSEKAAYLAARGLREAGDRVRGAPVSGLDRPKPVDTRHEVRMALKRVREMGQDVRRSEYQRIIKEGRHAQETARS